MIASLLVLSIASIIISIFAIQVVTNMKRDLYQAFEELGVTLEKLKTILMCIMENINDISERNEYEDSNTKIENIYRTVDKIHKNIESHKGSNV